LKVYINNAAIWERWKEGRDKTVYFPNERITGWKNWKFRDFLILSSKESSGLLRELTFTPNETPVVTSML
jgi:hypothetical protein